jgi:hypothetical protein
VRFLKQNKLLLSRCLKLLKEKKILVGFFYVPVFFTFALKKVLLHFEKEGKEEMSEQQNHKHGQKQVAGFVTFGIATAGLVLGIIDACNVSTIRNSYLKRDGSIPMTGDLNMDGHGFKNLFYLTLVNSTSAPTPGANITNFFSTGGGNLTQIDENGTTYTYLTQGGVGDFLPRDGSKPMFGHLDMGNNAILNQTTLLYLDGSAPMTGDLNMGGFNIVNLGLLSTKASNNNVVFGSGTTVSQTANQSNVLLGVNQAATGNVSTLIGNNLTSTGNGNLLFGTSNSATGNMNICLDPLGATLTGSSIVSIGRGNTVSASGNLVIGQSNSVASGSTSNVVFGSTNVVHASTTFSGAFGFNNSVTGTRAYAFGSSNTVNGTNSFVIGNITSNLLDNTIALGDSLTAMYPHTDNTVDLGLTASRFKNAYLTNNCYLAGLPASISEFSAFEIASFGGGGAEVIISNVGHVGTLTLPPMQIGASIEVTVVFIYSKTNTASADAIHIRLNNSTAVTVLNETVLPLLANTTYINVYGFLQILFTVRDTSTIFASSHIITAPTPVGSQATATYNSTISNTLTLSAFFDTGTGASFTSEQILLRSFFKTA